MSDVHVQPAEDAQADADNGHDVSATEPPSGAESSPARPPETDDEEDEEEEDEEKEPNLKYTRLTSSVASLYRSGDSSSAFAVTGDKMVCRAGHLGTM